MKLVRVFALSGVQTVSKLAFSFALVKFIAVSTGPIGLGLFNQFQTFISVLAIFATAPVSTGLVRYTSKYRLNEPAKSALFSTALWVALAVSLLCGVLLQIFAATASQLIFRSDQYTFVIRLVGASNAFAVLNALLMSILSGEREFKRLMLANLASNGLAVGLSILMIQVDGIHGAMLGYAIGQCLGFAATILLARGAPGIRTRAFTKLADLSVMGRLSSYTATTLITSAAVPAIEFVLRNRIATRYSWSEAGYWQSLTKISDAYLLVINSFLAIYFLPSVAAATTKEALRSTVFETARLVVPLGAVLALGIYIFRDQMILGLFSPSFLVVRKNFGVQLLGDVLRVLSGIVGYIIVARASRTTYLLTEAAFLVSYLWLGYALIDRFNWTGAVYAFALCHLVYLAIAPIVAWRILR